MERLTIRRNDGRWAIKNDDNATPLEQMNKIPRVIDRLAAYEDTGLEPDEIAEVQAYLEPIPFGRFSDIMEAEKDGRLVVLPFVAMVEQSLQNGKMTPKQDQRFNGRYAVVYMDKKKWASPLIDICGRHYDREEAEKRLAELTYKEAEAALKKRETDNEAD